MNPTSPRTATALSLLFLFALPFVFFWRETLGWTTLGDKDAVFWFYPAYQSVAGHLKQGHLPLLTPYLYCGSPLLAEWQAGVFDPLNWIYLFGLSSRTLTLTLQLSFALAMIAMFAFARSLGLGRRASIVAAIIYSLSGFAVGRAIYPGFLHIFALAPLALCFTERLYKSGRWRDCIGGALIIAWQVFAAHPQPLVYSSLLASAYALYCAFFRGNAGRRSFAFLAKFSVLFLGGAGLAAVQLFPAAEFARESVRREWPFELFTLHSLHPASLATTLVPFFHGEGKGIFHQPYWGPYWHNNEGQIYFGVIALSLAIAGAVMAWRDRENTGRFWSLVAIAGTILAMGRYSGPIAKLLFHVPILSQFRSPNRHWLEVTVAAAVLAGLAVDRLLRAEAKQMARVIVATAIALAGICAAMAGFVLKWPQTAEGLLRSLPDLAALPPGFLQSAGAEFLAPALAGVCAAIVLGIFVWRPLHRASYAILLGLLIADFHVYALYAPINNPAKLETLIGKAMPPALAAAQSERDPIRYHIMLDASTGEFNPFWFYGHEMATGYDPLLSQQRKIFLGIDEAGRTFNESMLASQDRTLDLLNVRYVLVRDRSATPLDPARWTELPTRSEVPPYKDYRVFENRRARPRAWLVDRVEVNWEGDQHKKIRGQIAGFDPSSAALVEPVQEGTEPWYRQYELHAESPAQQGTARILQRSPGHILIETQSARPSILILSEIAQSGWKAFVDGRPAPWHRVDFLLRSVALETPGKHTVEFIYDPGSVKAGMIVSVITALGLLLLWVRTRPRVRTQRSQERQERKSLFSWRSWLLGG